MGKEIKITPFSANHYPHNAAAAAIEIAKAKANANAKAKANANAKANVNAKAKDKAKDTAKDTDTDSDSVQVPSAMPDHVLSKLTEDWLFKPPDELPSAMRPAEVHCTLSSC
jgi:septal ring factor EnvC (AmiA/AmiB activator)